MTWDEWMDRENEMRRFCDESRAVRHRGCRSERLRSQQPVSALRTILVENPSRVLTFVPRA